MKINPIIIHESTDKWVKGKPEPMDKMGKEHDSLVRLWSRDDLSRRWETVADLLGHRLPPAGQVDTPGGIKTGPTDQY